MKLRKANVDDLELLIRLRLDYLAGDAGTLSPEIAGKIENQLRGYLPKHLSDDTFIGVIAETDTEVMCAVYLAISEKPANPFFLTGKTGTLLNVLTYSQYRRQGIATKAICRIIDEAKRRGVSSIELLATNEGKPLYERIGFSVSNHTAMRLTID